MPSILFENRDHSEKLAGSVFPLHGVNEGFGVILMKLAEMNCSPIWPSTHIMVGTKRHGAITLSGGIARDKDL